MATNEPVRVEQCDREEAFKLIRHYDEHGAVNMQNGTADQSWAVQAFARHRTLSQGDAEQRITRLNRERTDRQYMIDALVPMLGPKGREVWAAWQAKGVVRHHTSWVIDPMTMADEDVAQLHLDMEEAVKTAVPIDDVDAEITRLTEVYQEKNDG